MTALIEAAEPKTRVADVAFYFALPLCCVKSIDRALVAVTVGVGVFDFIHSYEVGGCISRLLEVGEERGVTVPTVDSKQAVHFAQPC